MSFCPKWVFEAACSAAAAEYLSRQLDLNTVANGYSAVLSEFYQPINPQEVASVIEQMLRFLDELDAGETAPFAGILFNPSALADLLSEKTYSDEECDLEVEYQVSRARSEMQLQLDSLQISYDALEEKHQLLMDIKMRRDMQKLFQSKKYERMTIT